MRDRLRLEREISELLGTVGETPDSRSAATAGSPPLPPLGDLAVRVEVVGRASPRWRSAKTRAEAERLNQRLSDLRATNVRKAVETILKSELPALPIVVPSKGVGSQQRFPTASEDNAAIDRSVLVTVDLATTTARYSSVPRGPRRIYMPSKVWTLKVLDMVRGAALGYVQIFLRIALRNPYLGREIKLSGWLGGGGAAMSVKDSFKLDRNPPTGKPIGREVDFLTPEAMDFDDFRQATVRVGKAEVAFGLKAKMTYLVFTEIKTNPDMLIFDHKSFGLGLLKADAFVVAGKLEREGPNPGDSLEVPGIPDLVATPTTRRIADGLLLIFPTGRAGLNDLTPADRKRLRDFVTNKARAIAALTETFRSSAPGP